MINRASAFLLLFGVVICMPGCGSQSSGKVKRDRQAAAAADAAVRSARAAIQTRDYARVEEILRPVLVADPSHADALFVLAQAQAAQGNLPAAVKSLDAIPQARSEVTLAALGQAADWLIELGQFAEAEQRLRKMIKSFGDLAPIHRRLAQLLNNQGRRFDAMPHMRALAQLGVATEPELYGMTTFSDPFIHRTAIPEQADVDSSSLTLARHKLYEGKSNEAFAIIDKLRAEQPNSTAVSAFLGRVIVDRQDDEAFSEWIASRPAGIEREPEYWSALGHYYQSRDKHDVAIRCFLEAATRDDTDRKSYLGLARSLDIVGKNDVGKVAMKRFQLLEQVSYIASEVERTPDQLNDMSDLLLKLHRPAEASGWNRVANKRGTSRTRQQSAGTEVGQPTRDWITCGIESSQWPLPDLKSTQAWTIQDNPDRSDSDGRMVLVDVADSTELQMQYLPGPPGTDLDFLLMHQTVGGGIAAMDYDLDGWVDLYLTQSGGEPFKDLASEPNHLFRNVGGEKFQRITEQAGVGDRSYAQGATACDINQDGFGDLIVANMGANVLLINNGDGTFRPQTYGPEEGSNLWTTSIACGDLDGDHLPEIIEVNYIDDPTVLQASCSDLKADGRCNPQRFRPATDRFLIARPDGSFESWLPEDAIPPGYGFAALIANIDDRFGNDLFIANDTDPNHYWQRQSAAGSEGRFQLRERAQILGCAIGLSGQPESCMGIAAGDFDRNGRMDFHITNYTFESSDLYLQQASGLFSNRFVRYGLETVTRPMLGWGTQAMDFDCDGWLDLVVLNGHLDSMFVDGTPYRMPPQVFRGSRTGFSDAGSDVKDEAFWTTPALGRTLAAADWNRDGKMDLIAYNIDTPAALLENRSPGGHWLQLELIGTESDRNAVGAKVSVACGDESWTSWITGGDGFQCKNESIVHIGIGSQQSIDAIEVTWPSGATSTYRAVSPNRRYLVIEDQAKLLER